jgi:uncharacterized protein
VKTALLDVNILTALLWPAHEHHDAAHRWFQARGQAHWATTPLTQLGFARLASNPAFSRDALSMADAVELLDENLEHAGHEFWPATLPLAEATRDTQTFLQGHGQLTDAYLLALAAERDGVLATFDRGFRILAGKKLASALEIVPAR